MIFTVFKKEFKEITRDRKTIMNMIIIPLAVFPLIMNLVAFFTGNAVEEVATQQLNIGIVVGKHTELYDDFKSMPEELGPFKLLAYRDKFEMLRDLKKDSIQAAGLVTPSNGKGDTLNSFTMLCYYNGAEQGIDERVKAYMQLIEKQAVQKRLKQLGMNEEIIKPMTTQYINMASDKEMLGKMAGGFLPYIIMSACFAGCFVPAIDLFSGEKERGTLETLLTTPILRWQILFGKMGVIILAGLISAACSLIGLYVSIQFLNSMVDQNIMAIVHKILSVQFILMLFCLLLPLVIFITGIMVPLAIYAKSFKEAQSMIGPLNIVLMVPAFVGMFPGYELNTLTACIPIVNIVLATKELIAGTLDMGLVLISFGVMSLLAVIAVLISHRQFGKETNILM
jgi:sodium transport system permease protein